jgi:hypothetical protein
MAGKGGAAQPLWWLLGAMAAAQAVWALSLW